MLGIRLLVDVYLNSSGRRGLQLGRVARRSVDHHFLARGQPQSAPNIVGGRFILRDRDFDALNQPWIAEKATRISRDLWGRMAAL